MPSGPVGIKGVKQCFPNSHHYLLDHAPHPTPFGYICGHQGAKCVFSCMCPTTLSFQPIFSKFAPVINWTILQTPVHFCHQLVTFVATRRPIAFFFSCVCPSTPSFQPIFSKLTPNIHWTVLHTPVNFCNPLVTFVATREPNGSFLVCALKPLVFNRSFPNSHQ